MTARPAINSQWHVHHPWTDVKERVTVVPTSDQVPEDEINVMYNNGSVKTVFVDQLCNVCEMK